MQFVNHFACSPDTQLTDLIAAHEVISRDSESRMSAHKIWIPAHVSYPPHTHPAQHIVIVLEGGGYLKMSTADSVVEKALTSGDMFHVPRDVRHQVGADGRGMLLMAVSVDSLELTDPERLQVVETL